jgi:catechol 2,3-dioxygenase-like lactoylglutathione lyase family enzyme
MPVVGVSVVSVPVSDQEQAKRFYVERLGLELVRDDESVPGIRWGSRSRRPVVARR